MRHMNKLIFAHLNTNSLRNKFEYLVYQVYQITGNIDILMISQTKRDSFWVG